MTGKKFDEVNPPLSELAQRVVDATKKRKAARKELVEVMILNELLEYSGELTEQQRKIIADQLSGAIVEVL